MSSARLLTKEVATLTCATADLSDLSISKKSRVYDPVWDFTDDLVHRPRSVVGSSLRVNWEKWPFSLPLRRELQRIFALFWKAPNSLSRRSREIKPNTLVCIIERSLDFLCDSIQSFASADLIESLEQIVLTDFQQAAKLRTGICQPAKRGLRILFHPNSEKVIDKRLQVTQVDINTLPKRERTKRTWGQGIQEIDGPALFSDDLFALLSDESTGRVQDFLRRLGDITEDQFKYAYEAPRGIPEPRGFQEVFHLYEQARRSEKGLSHEKSRFGSSFRYHLKKRVAVGLLSDYLTEVNIAAQCVLGLYVGARFSELASFQVGCLTERDGIWCIIGRNFKGKRDKNMLDDAWVAIPAVRDAVRALERLAGIKNNRFLLSSLNTAGGKYVGKRDGQVQNTGQPYQSGSLSMAMTSFIKIVDVHQRYEGWRFNSHQFKHSITRQLIKAKLGLPYISFHLKHLHNRLSVLPSDATLGYGNAGQTYQSEMAGYQIRELRRDLATKMYDPDSPIHGGAALEFDARRKSYFKGATDSGLSKEQVIDELATLGGSAFVNVGLGFCTGRKDHPTTGEKPPCIGGLRCNPNRCVNAVINREVHGPAWKRIASENRTMGRDPRFAYGKAQFEAAAAEAEEVCRQLGMDLDHG